MWSVVSENLFLMAAALMVGAVTGWLALKPRSAGQADTGDTRT